MKKKEIQGKKALKTFNLDSNAYQEFSEYCKREGISMSKRVEYFIKSELEKIKVLSGLGRVAGKMAESKGSMERKEENSFRKYC